MFNLYWRPRSHLQNVLVRLTDNRVIILSVLEQHLVHVGAGVLVQLVVAGEDDEGDLAVAQHRQLVRLLHEAKLALGERHLHKSNAAVTVLLLVPDHCSVVGYD